MYHKAEVCVSTMPERFIRKPTLCEREFRTSDAEPCSEKLLTVSSILKSLGLHITLLYVLDFPLWLWSQHISP